VTGKVERHEKFGVFVFLSPGRTGLMPLAETGVDRDTDVLKAFPNGIAATREPRTVAVTRMSIVSSVIVRGMMIPPSLVPSMRGQHGQPPQQTRSLDG
jgi:hypothetical protein